MSNKNETVETMVYGVCVPKELVMDFREAVKASGMKQKYIVEKFMKAYVAQQEEAQETDWIFGPDGSF